MVCMVRPQWATHNPTFTRQTMGAKIIKANRNSSLCSSMVDSLARTGTRSLKISFQPWRSLRLYKTRENLLALITTS